MTRAGWDLAEALAAATTVLGWLHSDHLMAEDIPHERIWHHLEQLEEWFAAVKQRREDRAKGMETVPDADDEGTLHNSLAEGLRN